jgi:hypothetical protein
MRLRAAVMEDACRPAIRELDDRSTPKDPVIQRAPGRHPDGPADRAEAARHSVLARSRE